MFKRLFLIKKGISITKNKFYVTTFFKENKGNQMIGKGFIHWHIKSIFFRNLYTRFELDRTMLTNMAEFTIISV